MPVARYTTICANNCLYMQFFIPVSPIRMPMTAEAVACATSRIATYRRRQPERSVLYRAVRSYLATWLELAQDESGRSAPAHVEREFRRYLECGILAHGFARARCVGCGHDFLVAFSCKGRGVCPSCNTRRMVETAAHLAEHVIPRLPVRQWVLSVPKRLRYFLQADPAIQNLALYIFLSAVEQGLRAACPGAKRSTARIGAVAFIHRFGSLLNPHVHFHCVVVDGIFEAGSEAELPLRFHEMPALDVQRLADIQSNIRRRLLRALTKRGLLEPEVAEEMVAWEHGGGFSLDAGVRIEAEDRSGLERLLLYCARPAFALERLRQIDPEHLVYESLETRPRRQCQPAPDAARTDRASGVSDSAAASASASLLRGAGAECAAAGCSDGPGSGEA